jgi:hypothetical protein
MAATHPVGTTSITVVLDHAKRHLGRRLWRRISGAAGGLLVVVGLTASIPAVPANLAVIGIVLGWLTTEPSDPDPFPPEDLPLREIFLGWAVTTPMAIVGVKGGLRLLRRNRTLILLLRRFGHDDAQSAVTFAVLQTIGAFWRVVTLDDAEMTPIGVPATTRRLFRVGHFTSTYVLAIGYFLGLRMFPILILSLWAVVAIASAGPAIEYAQTGTTRWEAWARLLEPYFTTLTSVFEWRLPFAEVGPTLHGLFALLIIAAAISFATLAVTTAALILALPFSTVLFFLSSTADAVREAERSKTVTVTSATEVQQAALAIVRRSRQVSGPRLVVLRVASNVWQHAVRQLVSVCSVTLIDISDPTENVLWELEELITRRNSKHVFVAHHARAVALASSDAGLTSVERRLAALLAGREVLAYTTDRRGLRRFARALRDKLIELDRS